MFVQSHLSMNKVNDINDTVPKIWNNLIRAMFVMNGEEPTSHVFIVHSVHVPLSYSNGNFTLNLFITSSEVNIKFRCRSNTMNDLGSALDIIAATTSALEYVVGREESLDITSWTVSVGDSDYVYQDVGVESITSVIGGNRESVIEFLEKRVEPKLDGIEEVCL